MNYTFPKLLVWIDQSLAPAALMSRELSLADFKSWTTYCENKSAKWKINISSYMLGPAAPDAKRQYLKAQQQQLVCLTNQVNRYLFKDKRTWSVSPHAAEIRRLYVSVLNIFEELLSYSEQYFPEFYDETVKVSDYKLQKILPQIRYANNELRMLLETANIDIELRDLVIKSVSAISAPGRISHANVKYIHNIIKGVKRLETLNRSTLLQLLMGFDFNRPEFYLYLTNAMNLKLEQIDGLHEQLEYIIQQGNDIIDTRSRFRYRFNPDEPSLKDDLKNFCTAKIMHLEKLLSHRRLAMQDKIDAENALRLLVDMPVPQFALFIRILKETQIIMKTGITEVCTFFAMHFYTDRSLFISSSNLLKRSTDIEFTTVLKLWDTLVLMQDWLDEKFSVRNYKRSL